MNYYRTGSFSSGDLRVLESALNQAWNVSQSRDYEEDPEKATELYNSMAVTIMRLASTGETGMQNLIQRTLMMVLPANRA